MLSRILLCYLFYRLTVHVESSLANGFSKFNNVRLGKESFETVKNLHLNWYINAMKALMGQLGKQLYNDLLPHEQKRLLSCLNDIGDKSDLIEGAKCLTTARNLASKKTRKFTHTASIHNSKKSSRMAVKALDANIAQNSFVVKHDGINYTNPPFLGNFNASFSPSAQTRSQIPTYKSRPSSLNSTADRFLKLNNSPSVVFAETNHDYDSDSSKLSGTMDVLSPEAIIMPQKSLSPEEVHREASFPSPVWSSSADSIPASEETTKERKYTKTMHLGANNKRRSDNIFQILNKNTVNREMAFEESITSADNKKGWRKKRFNQRWRKPLNPTRYSQTYCTKCIGHMSRNQRMNEPYDIKHRKRQGFAMKRKSGRFEFFSSKSPLKRRKRNSYAFGDDESEGHLMRNLQIKKMERISKLIDPTPKSLAQRVTHLIRSAIHGNETLKDGEWSKAYKRLLQFKKALEEKKKLPGAKVYERRLYDIVVDSKYPTISPKRKERIPDLLVSAYNLIDSLGGKHAERASMNFKFLSPRFAPIMPDKFDNQSRYFSPSFLAFYKDESADNIASLPKVLEDGGMDKRDREAIIETLMDISGANDAVNKGLDLLSSFNFTGLEDELVEVTSRLGEAFKELEGSLNAEQKNEINNNGFTFLEAQQMRQLMKTHGVQKMDDVGFDIESYENLSKQQRYTSLWRTVERIANNETSTHKRSKRQAVSVLAPLVLAPFVFSTIVGLSILGPVVLSPSIFSVLLLNPSVLGPFVLSPAFFLPFIVSPYVLTPYVLSPIFGAPFILNPYVLSPNVINPYILSPLILSPYVFCPDVYSPQALGGPILSPSAFSPAFMTESVLMASVLSPTFMS